MMQLSGGLAVSNSKKEGDMTLKEILLAVLGGGVAVAIIEAIKEIILWHRNRKAQKEDRAEEKKEEQIEQRIDRLESEMGEIRLLVTALVDSQKNVLFDRIQYLCRRYMSEGEIDFDDLRGVNALHNSYHNGLGGNGDLDALMKQVHSLPVKPKS